MHIRLIPLAALLSLIFAIPAYAEIDCRPLRGQYEGRSLFLQHNLRYEDEDASWVNFFKSGNILPLGTAVRVEKMKEDEVILQVEGRSEELSLDMDDGEPSCTVILERLLGSQAPDTSGLGETDLKGIKRGAIGVGMTRRAVFLAVGYPPHYYTPAFVDRSVVNHDPQDDVLTYMASTWDFLTVTFINDVVTAIDD